MCTVQFITILKVNIVQNCLTTELCRIMVEKLNSQNSMPMFFFFFLLLYNIIIECGNVDKNKGGWGQKMWIRIFCCFFRVI